MSNMTTLQSLAAGQVLTDWPDEFTYNELLEAITDEHEDVIVWDAYDCQSPSLICETIEDQLRTFQTALAVITQPLRDAICEGDPQTIADRLASFEQTLGV